MSLIDELRKQAQSPAAAKSEPEPEPVAVKVAETATVTAPAIDKPRECSGEHGRQVLSDPGPSRSEPVHASRCSHACQFIIRTKQRGKRADEYLACRNCDRFYGYVAAGKSFHRDAKMTAALLDAIKREIQREGFYSIGGRGATYG